MLAFVFMFCGAGVDKMSAASRSREWDTKNVNKTTTSNTHSHTNSINVKQIESHYANPNKRMIGFVFRIRRHTYNNNLLTDKIGKTVNLQRDAENSTLMLVIMWLVMLLNWYISANRQVCVRERTRLGGRRSWSIFLIWHRSHRYVHTMISHLQIFYAVNWYPSAYQTINFVIHATKILLWLGKGKGKGILESLSKTAGAKSNRNQHQQNIEEQNEMIYETLFNLKWIYHLSWC